MMGDATGMIDKLNGVDAGDEDHGGINDPLHVAVADKGPKNTTLSVWTRGRFSGRITIATEDLHRVQSIVNGRSRSEISTSEKSPEQR